MDRALKPDFEILKTTELYNTIKTEIDNLIILHGDLCQLGMFGKFLYAAAIKNQNNTLCYGARIFFYLFFA